MKNIDEKPFHNEYYEKRLTLRRINLFLWAHLVPIAIGMNQDLREFIK